MEMERSLNDISFNVDNDPDNEFICSDVNGILHE